MSVMCVVSGTGAWWCELVGCRLHSRLGDVISRLGWTGRKSEPPDEAPPPDEPKAGGLRLKQSDPESLSGNPMLERYPEPPRGGPRWRIPWGKLLVLLIVVGVAAAAVFYLPGLLDSGDPRVWERAKQWLESHESPPNQPRALSELRDIVLDIEADKGNGEARAGLMALYGLGALHTGNPKGWQGTIGALEREAEGSSFIGLVRDVKLDNSVQMKCSGCGGNGKCRNCGGRGKSADAGLARRPARDRREIGHTLENEDAPMKTCPVCRGTGKCPQCSGRGEVTTTAREAVADDADLEERWGTVREETVKLVGRQYWKSRGARELSKVQNMLTSDGLEPATDSEDETARPPTSPAAPAPAATEPVRRAPASPVVPQSSWSAPSGVDESPTAASAPSVSAAPMDAGSAEEGVAAQTALYKRQMANIEALCREREHKWADAYLRELDGLQRTLREAGDLEGWEQVDFEIKRFKVSRGLTESLEASPVDGVNEFRHRFRSVWIQLQLAKAEAALGALRSQKRKFETLKAQLTRADRIAEAKQARSMLTEIAAAENETAFRQTALESELKKLDLERGKGDGRSREELDLEELAELRAVFDREKESIEQEYIANMSSWDSAYAAALEQVKAQMQQSGNLEAWEAVEQERRRFMATASISGNLENAPTALSEVRNRYRSLREEYPTTRDENIESLTEMYVKHLNGLKQAYVRDGKIEQARVVREEIARVEGM